MSFDADGIHWLSVESASIAANITDEVEFDCTPFTKDERLYELVAVSTDRLAGNQLGRMQVLSVRQGQRDLFVSGMCVNSTKLPVGRKLCGWNPRFLHVTIQNRLSATSICLATIGIRDIGPNPDFRSPEDEANDMEEAAIALLQEDDV